MATDDSPSPNPGLLLLIALPTGLPVVVAVVASVVDGIRLLPAIGLAYAAGLVLAPVLAFAANSHRRRAHHIDRTPLLQPHTHR